MPQKINPSKLRTWIEVDRKALRHNFQIFKKLAGRRRLLAVVKSNAYGHGLIDGANYFNQLGVDWFGVDSAPEALALRRSRIGKPILVLGYTLPDNLAVMASHDISLTVSSFETLEAIKQKKKILAAEGRQLAIHIKIDSGMHRQGFLPSQTSQVITELKNLPYVKVEGLYTHLADAAGSGRSKKRTSSQFSVFYAAVKQYRQAGFRPIIHVLNTAGVLVYPKSVGDMIRIGLGLYGLWPESKLKTRLAKKITLKPALAWKTVVSEIKSVPAGEAVGYSFTETLKRPTILAVCPVGYWHGYPRALSSIGQVIVNKKRARIVGRISMDMLVIDVTSIGKMTVGAIVTLFDSQILVAEAAAKTGTIPYEIVTRLNPLIKRFYV